MEGREGREGNGGGEGRGPTIRLSGYATDCVVPRRRVTATEVLHVIMLNRNLVVKSELNVQRKWLKKHRKQYGIPLFTNTVFKIEGKDSSPVSIQTQSLALRALRFDGNRALRCESLTDVCSVCSVLLSVLLHF